MKKVLFITNIPAPYRIDFYNELGKYVDLTVVFEAKSASNQGIKFNWNFNSSLRFKAIFLSEGDIHERQIDWRIFQYLKKNKYDNIFVTNYSYFTEMAAILYLKARKIPYIMETDGGMIRAENKLKRWYKRVLVKGAVAYFSPSESSDEYLSFYGANKERMVRYPFTSLSNNDILQDLISVNEKMKLRKKLGIMEEHVVIGVGRFIYIKGWEILIKAISKIKDNVGLYIVGGEPTKEYIELVKSLGVSNVHFVGFKSKADLAEYYKASDVFAMPTRGDVWGLVVNEAMAYGLPVVTTERCVAGLELIENGRNGYIVPVDDIDAFSERIHEIISADLDTYSYNSLDTIKRYTIQNMVEVHLRYLQ